MLDINHIKHRKDVMRKTCGVTRKGCNPYQEDTETYSIYYNPSNWIINGIMDNERNKFYKISQEDLIGFVNVLNVKSNEYTDFLENIEFSLKSRTDRLCSFNEVIGELNGRIAELEEENDKLRQELLTRTVDF